MQSRWSRVLVVSGVVLSKVLLLRVSAVAASVPGPVVVDPVFLVGVLGVFEGVGPFYIFVVVVVVVVAVSVSVSVVVVVVCGIAIDLLHIKSVPSLSRSPLLSPLLLLFLHSDF